MRVEALRGSITDSAAPYVVVPVPVALREKEKRGKDASFPPPSDKTTTRVLGELDSSLGKQLSKHFQRSAESALTAGKRVEVAVADRKEGQVRFVRLSGVSPTQEENRSATIDHWRRLGGDAYHGARKQGVDEIEISLEAVGPAYLPDVVQAIVEGAFLAQYTFTRYKSNTNGASKKTSVQKLRLLLDASPTTAVKQALKVGESVANAVGHARDLVNLPPNDLYPEDLVREAKLLASRSRGRVTIKTFGRSALQKLGAGALLAVAQGSEREPFLIHLHYKPKKREKKHRVIALVGKGVTFDSGGLSIKTGKGMEEMKMDMAGAACVLNVLRAVLDTESEVPFPHELHVVIPTTENMINGRATRPGDIVCALNKKTIEILNTDAEGRLILADALAYIERVKPDVVIDVATLTGACIVALGNDYAGLFTKSNALRDMLLECSQAAGERVWPLPIAEEYRPSIDSPSAYIKNVSANGPGAIVGALFLQEFVPSGSMWAHLDIAGPAFQTKATEVGVPGGTGFGVLTLLNLLRSPKLTTLQG